MRIDRKRGHTTQKRTRLPNAPRGVVALDVGHLVEKSETFPADNVIQMHGHELGVTESGTSVHTIKQRRGTSRHVDNKGVLRGTKSGFVTFWRLGSDGNFLSTVDEKSTVE